MTGMGDQIDASIRVAAEPEAVYHLVSDLPRMGEWSPECYRCQWLGDMQVAVPGAKFKGYNRRGMRRWTTHGTIATAEAGKELSFDVHSVLDLPVARWTYRITPEAEGGCTLTEVWEDRRGGVMKVLGNLASGVSDRREHNAAGMKVTLQRIKTEAEG
jgi:polyketide cyclase/dehydrase/lipid transport protein